MTRTAQLTAKLLDGTLTDAECAELEALVSSDPAARTDEEWSAALTPEQYRVLRRHGTERAGTSELNQEKRRGTFVCAGCKLRLFSSRHRSPAG